MASTSLQTQILSLPIGSLDAYIHRVNQIPMLGDDEEKELAMRWYEHQDVEAARRMVMAHLRFVVKIARSYSGEGLAVADLIQEGNVGLMKAVKRFNPHVGVRLVSFAVHWIKAEMHEFILRNWRIVKVATTKAQRKLFFNLRKSKKRLGWFTREEVNSVAEDLGVAAKDVMEMEARLNARDAAFDGYDDDDSGSASSSSSQLSVAPKHFLEDHSADPAQMHATDSGCIQDKMDLQVALNGLDDRSKDIVQARWLTEKKMTLHDLAAKYKVSAERIRQLEQLALKKMRSAIEAVEA